jgi:hypothetical protein
MNSQPQPFDDGIDDAAATMARCCERSPDITDLQVAAFIAAHKWLAEADSISGALVWRHPTELPLERRCDVLAWCLADSRRRSGQWPRFCRPCW